MGSTYTGKNGICRVYESTAILRSLAGGNVEWFDDSGASYNDVTSAEDVPEAVLEKYAQFKRRCDICGAGEVRGKDLIMLAVCGGEFISEGGEDLLPPNDE